MSPKPNKTVPMKFGPTSAVLHLEFPKEESAIRVLGAIFACLTVAYLALVSMSIVNVIAKQEATEQMASMRSVVGDLEREYFTLSQEITQASGATLGLVHVSKTDYVRQPGAVGVVTDKRSEI